jgi:signal transduction histidine kinase
MSSKTDLNTPAKSDLLTSYERLLEISQQLNSTLDLAALLRKIISAAEELTDTEGSSIMLYDPQTGDLRFEVTSNLNPNETDAIIVPMEGSIAGWIFTHGEPRWIEDVSQEPSYYHGVEETVEVKTRNLIGVPMRTHNKVIGVLEALNKRQNQRFTEQDIKVLTILASQAAIAIENARLFQQSDFIAEMVHELRTPLTALKASTTLLLRPNVTEERRQDIITTMQGETDRLIRMTSDFLDLSRLESGRTRLDTTAFDVHKLIAESAEVVQQQAHDKGIQIKLPQEVLMVFADRGKIKQVLLNLFTNAIKYNRENGSITVETSRVPKQDKTFVQIAVRDTGYGISKESQKNMFQKFYRVAETANFSQGTGLGLAIAKHIIEAHDGSIWLESEQGVGSTFYITLPTS